MHRLFLFLGALLGLTAVGLSAWAAHGAPVRLDPGRLAMLRSGIEMQGWHALALLAAGLWAERRAGLLPRLAGLAFVLGTLAFCGAIYAAAILGISFGPVAPLGGSLLMAGWALLAASAVRSR
jgi:uncharacterized membrane protein YgdD (TMEM256/DUF423 family)